MSLASKALKYWRSITFAHGIRGLAIRRVDQLHHPLRRFRFRGEYVPVVFSLGLVLLAVSLGVHTAKLQLVHSPKVLVDKKKRGTVPEVEDPDWSVQASEYFVKKSVFRKGAQLQEFNPFRTEIPDPTCRPANKALPRKTETLKEVAVESPGIETRVGRFREPLGNLTDKKE